MTGAIVLAIVASIPLTILHGFVLSVLWGWFFVPQFGLPPLSIPAAIGVALFVTASVFRPDKEPLTIDYVVHGIASSLAKALVVLSIGYVASLFV